MKNLTRYLCLLILTLNCAALQFEADVQIESPENCSIVTGEGSVDHMLCPDFNVTMTKFINTHSTEEEYRSTIECSSSSLPYPYLPYMSSTRNSLEFINCQLPESGSVGEGWPRLQYLRFNQDYDFNHKNFKPLKKEHFSGLNNLWNLNLNTISDHEMPDDLFTDLPKLKKISIGVRKINKNLFTNLRELETLQITIKSRASWNNFDLSKLETCPKLKTLTLNSNRLPILTKRFFQGCSRIENLILSFNSMYAIDNEAFEPLTNLKNIKMIYNKHTSLPGGLFSKNRKLEKILIFKSTNLTSIPSGFLSNLPNLREIKINDCNLTAIPNDLIHGSNNLELINLEFNDLTSIPKDFFKNHLKLKKIRLFGNKLPIYTSDYFDDISPSTEIDYEFYVD